MSWFNGNQHIVTSGNGGAQSINTTRMPLNKNQQQISSQWNQSTANIQQIPHLHQQQPPNWFQQNQNSTLNQPLQSQYYQPPNRSLNSNVANPNINNKKEMTSQYFDNTAISDGWGDDNWGDFDDVNNQFTSQSHQGASSPNQNTINNPQPNVVYGNQPQFAQPFNYNQTVPQNQHIQHVIPQNNPSQALHQQSSSNNLQQQQLLTLQKQPPLLQNTEIQPIQNILPAQIALQNLQPVNPQFQQNYQPNYNLTPGNQFQSTSQNNFPQTIQNFNHDQINNDNGNWNLNHNAKVGSSDELNQNLFPKVSQNALQHVNKTSDGSSSNVMGYQNTETDSELKTSILNNENLTSSRPDEYKNTQNIENPLLTRIKRSEHLLTPQWSTESQMSQTSSDRSIESDNIDTRSSATNTSDEPTDNIYGRHDDTERNMIRYSDYNKNSRADFTEQRETKSSASAVDSLDQALLEINAGKTELAASINFYQPEPTITQTINPVVVSKESHLHPRGNQMESATLQHQIEPLVEASNTNSENFRFNRDQPNKFPPNFNNFSTTSIEKLNKHVSQKFTSDHIPQSGFDALSQDLQSNSSSKSSNLLHSTINPNAIPLSSNSSISSNPMMQIPINLQNNPLTSNLPIIASMSSTNHHGIPPAIPPPQIQSSQLHSTNPFKRTGMLTHKNLNFPAPLVKPPTTTQTNFYPEPAVNQEIFLPENSENLEIRNNEVENLEIAPTNERNQYLQTGHLSEDGHLGDGSENVPLVPENNDNLPPPGLSRLVLGQPESDNYSSSSQVNPPPGLDRMVPGNELTSSTDVNVNRQADGQASNATSQIRISDRNLYHVPGESQSQRVIPGIEHERRNIQPNEIDIVPINEQQRELVMEGENLDDQQQPSLEIASREEPIEGANTLDEIAPGNANQAETELSLTYEVGRKDLSNPSTANDDSDKDRHSYYSKSRRSEENSARKKNKPKERYDTEDTDYYSDRDRRRYMREGSARRDRERDSHERERQRDRRDGIGRDRYDRGSEKENDKRYDRDRYRDQGRYDRNNRYETDSSKYEDGRERRRYDREDFGRRRDEESYRREEKERRYRRGDRDDKRKDTREKYRDDREKDKRRDRRGDYENDNLHRSGSRNALDRDHEKERRYPQSYYGYNYDPYMYYQQQQQYYENLRRTNPQAYAEWYRKYYSQMQSQVPSDIVNADGRESVHSGRSSANEKERYSRQTLQEQYYHQATTAQQSQVHNTSYMERSFLNGIGQQQSTFVVPSRSYYTQSEFSESRVDNLDSSLHLGSTSITQSQRLTPCKFTYDHSVASIQNGLLVCLKPNPYLNSNATNVVKIMNLTINDSSRKLLNAFPGPLVRGITHKKTVIEFCEDQILLGPPSSIVRSRGNSVSSIQSSSQANKPSFVLMWNFLILLLKQNGTVVGADIAELLIKNKSEFPYDILSSKSGTIPPSGRNSALSDARSHENLTPSDDNIIEDENGARTSSEDREVDNSNQTESKPLLGDETITEKFRSYLLYGNVNEALDWATDNNLWGHALFLASKVDRRAHANVMMKFANKLTLNDPLQTLFQLMSGKIPSAVTSVQDEKWGDWRSHLAMIISNTAQKPDLGRKAITTLGDSLHNRGDLFGAQFCYLISEVEFGKYSNVNQDTTLMFNSASTIRLILLGSSHHKSFKEFATNEAIMMTEIYEYACTLNDEKFSIVEFQPYKFLLANRMLDYGLQFKTLLYLEQIANHIKKDLSKYSTDFIEKVYVLADRLKFFDPAIEKTLEDYSNMDGIDQSNINTMEDQKWLQDLKYILNNSQDQPEIANNYQYDDQQQNLDYQAEFNKQKIDQEFTQINQQFSELTMKYTKENLDQPPTTNFQTQQQNSRINNEIPMYGNIATENYYEQQGHNVEEQSRISNENANEYYAQQQNSNEYGQIPISNDQQPPTQQYQHYDYWNNAQQLNSEPKIINTPKMEITHQIQQPSQVSPILNTVASELASDKVDSSPKPYSLQANINNFNEIPKPTISMPNSMSSKPGFYEESPVTTGRSDLSNSNNDNISLAASNKNEKTKQAANKNANQSGSTSGWFGGIFNKLSLKPKNQMILPDDKNPPIVWDPEKKKWVNTDGGEEEQESFKPPPKMSDITQPPIQQTSLPPPSTFSNSNPQLVNENSLHNNGGMPTTMSNDMTASMIDPNKIPNLQSNMFKMQRNRTLKKSYVDVFNPSGAPAKATENMLAPVSQLPPVPQSGFFIPGAPNKQQNNLTDIQPQQPQFYNPNQYGGYDP